MSEASRFILTTYDPVRNSYGVSFFPSKETAMTHGNRLNGAFGCDYWVSEVVFKAYGQRKREA